MSASVRDYTILGVTQARGSTGSGGGGVVSGGAIALETSQHDIEGLEHTNRTGALLAGNVISPAELVADTDDWSPTSLSTADVIRASMDSAHALTGLAALTASSGAGKALILANVGTVDMTLTHEDASSTAINRFLCPNDEDLTLSPDAWVLLWYDATSERWRVTGTGSASSDPGASLVPYYLGAGETFNVPVGRQALFADAIELDADATIEVDGELIEVDATPAAPASTTPSGVRNQPVYPMPLLFGEQGEDGEPGARGETGARGASSGSSSSAASGPYAMVGESDTEDAIDRAIAVVDHRVLVQEVDGAPSGLVDGFVYPNDSVTLVGGKAVIRQVPYGFVGCLLTQTAASVGGNGSYVAMLFDTESDSDNFHSLVSNTGRATIPAGMGGRYLISGNAYGGSWGAGYMALLKNGASQAYCQIQGGGAADGITTILELVPGDYIELGVNGASATNSQPGQTRLSVFKLDSGRVGSGIGAKAFHNTTQAGGNNAAVLLAYNDHEYDTDGFHSKVTNNSRLTIPPGLGGKYLIGAVATSATSVISQMAFLKNGATQLRGGTIHAGSGGGMGTEYITVADLAPGDYLEASLYTSSTCTIEGSSSRSTVFWIMRLDTSASVAATYSAAAIAADVTMTSANTYYDGPAVTIGPGTWQINWRATFRTVSPSGGQFTARVWDGTTILDEAQNDGTKAETASIGNGWVKGMGGSFVVVLTAASTTLTLRGASTSAGQKLAPDPAANSGGSHTATRITAVRIST